MVELAPDRARTRKFHVASGKLSRHPPGLPAWRPESDATVGMPTMGDDLNVHVGFSVHPRRGVAAPRQFSSAMVLISKIENLVIKF
jgi:hypothetical protein